MSERVACSQIGLFGFVQLVIFASCLLRSPLALLMAEHSHNINKASGCAESRRHHNLLREGAWICHLPRQMITYMRPSTLLTSIHERPDGNRNSR
ncbi:hypothetical protein GGR50DRAFT_652137 [Xylaria sp. CBS 124048]|nr:hypothetical protein GGR50DRAFT_652137 [Xylaria sp. CBS 124048]